MSSLLFTYILNIYMFLFIIAAQIILVSTTIMSEHFYVCCILDLNVSGFIPPTSGTALVNGYDIRTDINSVRSNLGLCPQHNILFDTLTVDEHLKFFARV